MSKTLVSQIRMSFIGFFAAIMPGLIAIDDAGGFTEITVLKAVILLLSPIVGGVAGYHSPSILGAEKKETDEKISELLEDNKQLKKYNGAMKKAVRKLKIDLDTSKTFVPVESLDRGVEENEPTIK